MRLQQNTYWLIYPLFVLACAKQTAPTGGPKDTIPPVLITSKPFNQQTNYTASSLELTFDERLLLNNPKEQIIITPNVGNKFEAETKKNTVIIKFDSPFDPNTTYSLNFRDAVQDITEKNPVENLKLAFSTGDYIDSLIIEGHVYDLLKSTETKDATVALFQTDTFNIFKHKPIYFTKSDTKGNFQLTNLKPGNYYIYAFDDKNKNLIVESKSESYGYLVKTIQLNKDTSNINIPTIRLDTRPLKLTSARPTGTYFNIKTSKNLDYYQLETQPSTNIYSSYAEDFANIRIYNTISLRDSMLIRLTASDSVSNKIDTLLYLKYSTRTSTPEKFQITESKFKILTSKGILSGQVSFNKPLLSINYDSIFYQIDSTTRIPINQTNLQIDTANNLLKIHKTIEKELLNKQQANKLNNTQPKSATKTNQNIQTKNLRKSIENQIYLAKGTLISVEQDSSAKISSSITPIPLENTGTILCKINTKHNSFILQLTTKDYKVIATSYNNKNPSFEDLEPGEYKLRLIIDKNNDGKWNPGNYLLHQEPESIVFYKNEKQNPIITLKANWELGPLLITY